MKETKFIEQNKQKWREFERILESKKKDPDKLSDLFIQITDDLSFSRTFYPNRSVRVYLNDLAQKVFNNIYKNRKSKLRNFVKFWIDDLPQIMFEARRDLLFAFVLFLFAFTIGAVSSYMDPDFPRIILGDYYVDMTIENIESNDPMKVYKNDNELLSSLQITINNLKVAFFTFVGGIFFMLGTLSVIFYNGIMVGAFQMFFAMHDFHILKESLLTIWIHGTLEISAIILAGAAGITMGRGLVFPKTYSRLQSFQISSKRGVKMMLGIFPIFVIAGFIEGFITRHTDTPDIVRLLFIILCFIFVITYYVIFPLKKARKNYISDIYDTQVIKIPKEYIDYFSIKSNGSIITDTFTFFRKNISLISKVAVASAFTYTLLLVLIYGLSLPDIMIFKRWAITVPSSWYIHGENIGQLFQYKNNTIFLLIMNAILFSIIIFYILGKIKEEQKKKENNENLMHANELKNNVKNFISTFVIISLYQLSIKFLSTWFFLLFPIVMLWLCSLIFEQNNIFTGMLRSIKLMSTSFFNSLGLSIMIIFIMILFSFISNVEITWHLIDVIGWNFADRVEVANTFLHASLVFIFTLSFGFFLPILATSFSILYFSLLEINEATSLRKQITKIGESKKVFGIDREL